MQSVSDIDLRLLRVFVAVVEAGGFSAAESYLNVSTSTISVHMSNLEKRIGVRLCERGRSGFRLTERGRIVFEETKRLLKSLEDYSGTLAGIKSLLGGSLAIGMVDCLVTHPRFPISKAIRRFNELDNDVQIQLVVAARQTLEHDVVDGRLHAAIGPFIRKISGLRFVPLFKERHEVYCGVGHPLFKASRTVIAKADFSVYPAIVRIYHHEFDRARLGVVREGALVYSIEAMLTLLLSGGYIGYLPRHYARKWVEDDLLAPIPRTDLGYQSKHALIVKQSSRESLALKTFVSIVRKVCAA